MKKAKMVLANLEHIVLPRHSILSERKMAGCQSSWRSLLRLQDLASPRRGYQGTFRIRPLMSPNFRSSLVGTSSKQ